MHKFVRNLLTEWRKLGLPFEDAAIVVAVSGGADSVSLLLAIEDLKKRGKLKLTIVVAHLNHGLRGAESDADAEYTEKLTKSLGCRFVTEKRQIAARGNLEQNARNARHSFLQAIAKEIDAVAILTAHTINDQAETFLMNLLRGSGIDGIAGMKAVSFCSNADLKLVRPFLNWAKRGDTEDYCRFREIFFREDSMNKDPDFTRVRIRRELLPQLSEYNPKIVETIASTARLLRFEVEANESLVTDEFGDSIKTRLLKGLDEAALYKTIRRWLKSRRGDLRGIGLKHFQAIERLINSRKSGRVVELPGRETVVRRDGDLIWIRGNGENGS